MNAWDFLRDLHLDCQFQTREGKKVGLASSSELKRWLVNGAVVINGKKVKWDEEIVYPINSMVLFPKHPTTIW